MDGSLHRPLVVNLPSGYMMYNDITRSIAECAWNLITDEQKQEFVVLYGDEERAKKGIFDEILTAEHKASFYNGTELMALMWADWDCSKDGQGVRTLGCVTTAAMQRHKVSFAMHSIDMCEAFMLNEPPSVSKVFVAIQASFKRSVEWARRMCGFRQVGCIDLNGEPFILFSHTIGEDER